MVNGPTSLRCAVRLSHWKDARRTNIVVHSALLCVRVGTTCKAPERLVGDLDSHVRGSFREHQDWIRAAFSRIEYLEQLLADLKRQRPAEVRPTRLPNRHRNRH